MIIWYHISISVLFFIIELCPFFCFLFLLIELCPFFSLIFFLLISSTSYVSFLLLISNTNWNIELFPFSFFFFFLLISNTHLNYRPCLMTMATWSSMKNLTPWHALGFWYIYTVLAQEHRNNYWYFNYRYEFLLLTELV